MSLLGWISRAFSVQRAKPSKGGDAKLRGYGGKSAKLDALLKREPPCSTKILL
jgi:hypothetical protein